MQPECPNMRLYRQVDIHWLRYIQALLSLVELLHYCALISRELHSDATPALLWHKELAQRTKRSISCLSLVLYGIRIGSLYLSCMEKSFWGWLLCTERIYPLCHNAAWIYLDVSVRSCEMILVLLLQKMTLWLMTSLRQCLATHKMCQRESTDYHVSSWVSRSVYDMRI